MLSVVSPSFRESGGTSSPEDDLDYASLAKKLPERLNRAQGVRIDIDVRSITMHKDSATAIYYYNMQFRLPGLSGRPQSESDLKQMTLLKEEGAWKISSGV
jgi:hypothetical protein